jgi:hypothetical protein
MDAEDAFAPYLGRLRELPFVRDARVGRKTPGPSEIDAVVSVRTPTGKLAMPAVLKRTHLTRDLGHRLALLGKSVHHLLVLAPAVGRDLGDELTKANVNYVDLAGNCHVRIGDQFLARIEGRRTQVAPVEKSLRAASYRVLFALLVDPSLVTAPARKLAQAAGGVSAQTAIDLRARLRERRIVVPRGGKVDWRPGGRKEAFETLVAGFSATLHPSLATVRFRSAERDLGHLEARLEATLAQRAQRDVRGTKPRWRWGGGAACSRLAGHFRGDKTLIYFDSKVDVPVAELRLLPDPGGSIAFARAPGPLAFDASPRPDTVHPLLAYLDLLSDPDPRAREGAAAVYERWLAKGLAE